MLVTSMAWTPKNHHRGRMLVTPTGRGRMLVTSMAWIFPQKTTIEGGCLSPPQDEGGCVSPRCWMDVPLSQQNETLNLRDPRRSKDGKIVHLMRNGNMQLVAYGDTDFHGSWGFDPREGLWLRFNCRGPRKPEHMSRVFPTSSGQWDGWDYDEDEDEGGCLAPRWMAWIPKNLITTTTITLPRCFLGSLRCAGLHERYTDALNELRVLATEQCQR